MKYFILPLLGLFVVPLYGIKLKTEIAYKPSVNVKYLSIMDENGNEKIEPGEKISLKFRAENNTKGIARNTKITASSNIVNVKTTHLSLGNIPPKASKSFNIHINIPDSITAHKFTVSIKITGKGFSSSVDFPFDVYFPKVDLIFDGINDGVSGLASGNGNGKIEIGERIEAKFRIINNEPHSYSNVKLYLEAEKGIILNNGEEKLSVIQSGAERNISLAFTVTKSYKGSNPLPIRAVLKSGNILLGSKDLNLTYVKSATSAGIWMIIGGIILIIFVILIVAIAKRKHIPVSTERPASQSITPKRRVTPVSERPAGGTVSGADIGLSQEAQERYILVREIGKGGMGVVYEAKDTVLDRRVALKVMRAEISLRRRERERFLKEARTSARLNHPNIVTLYDIVEDESGQIFLVFEYVDGGNLSHLIDNEKISLNKSIDIGTQVLEGLKYAHTEGVIHRDLKPSNVMITKRGRAKILDFGIARVAYDTIYTFTGQTSGTPAYMAPEQHLGEKTDERSDIYSFGATLYEMLTGELPFKGADLLVAKREKKVIPPTEINSEIPKYIEEIILQCLEPDRENRPKSAEELIKRLKKG